MHNGETKLTEKKRITLKILAAHLGFTAGTISAVLNDSPAARRIPQATKERILAGAREFNYQPNALARALRTGHVLAPSAADEAQRSRGALVIVGADQFLGRAVHAMQQAGLRVPGDVTVMGVDGLPLSMIHDPAAAAEASPA